MWFTIRFLCAADGFVSSAWTVELCDREAILLDKFVSATFPAQGVVTTRAKVSTLASVAISAHIWDERVARTEYDAARKSRPREVTEERDAAKTGAGRNTTAEPSG